MFQSGYDLASQGLAQDEQWLEKCTLTLLRHDDYLTYLRIADPETSLEWDAARAPLACAVACQRLERDFQIPLQPEWAIVPTAFVRSVEGPMVIYPRVTNVRETWAKRSFSLPDFLHLATAAANALALSHAAGVIHGNLTPEHIAVVADGVRLHFFKSFDINARRERGFCESQWPYVSPEQLHSEYAVREVASDVYSLAVILYEVLVRQLPLEAESLVQWLHVHAAVQPALPSERCPDVPEVLGLILLKCLAKDPGARYLRAETLAADLAHCSEQWVTKGRIEPFELGLLDRSVLWSTPVSLIGREAEHARLCSVYANVAQTGQSAMVVISGSAGEGKSTLVQHWLSAVSPAYCASGKSRSLQREIPYAPFRHILAGLARLVSGKSFEEVERFKTVLTEKLEGRGRLIIDLCPAFEAIIGPASEPVTLSAYHAMVRANQTLLDVLEVFGSAGKPLVIFLDDIQWADESTLSLLRAFLDAPPACVCLVVAHRASSMPKLSAPGGLLHEASLAKFKHIETLALRPFSVEAVAQLLADHLRMNADELAQIAALIHFKTAGNPFFIIQILRALIDDRLLTFDALLRQWNWVLEDVARHRYADNVADLMVHRLNRLPEVERELMRLASCVGVRVDEPVLRALSGLEEVEFTKVLGVLTEAGFLMHKSQALIFPHDRIHEAAYGLTPLELRPALHGQVATLMIALSERGLESTPFEIANQIHCSVAHSGFVEQQDKAVGVLLQAAQLAKHAGAVTQAAQYLLSADSLLAAMPSGDAGGLAFAVRWLAAECNVLLAELDKAEALIAVCFEQAGSVVDRANTFWLQATLKTLRSDHEGAISAALEGLSLLGMPLQRKPAQAELDEVYRRIRALIGQRSISELTALPEMDEPRIEAAMKLLSTLISSFFVDDGMGFMHLAKMVELTLLHGTSPASCYGLAWFGVMIASRYEAYVDGHQFVQLALDIGEQRRYETGRTSTLLALDQVSPWTLPLAFARQQALKAFETGRLGEDLVMACYAVTHLGADMFVMGEPLDAVQDELDRGLAFIRPFGYFDVERIVEAQKQFALDLQFGPPARSRTEPGSAHAPLAQGQVLSSPARFWTLLYSGMSACLLGDAAFAIRQFKAAQPLLWSVAAHINLSSYYLFYSLALGQPQAPGALAGRLARLAEHRRHFVLWARLNPATFRHKLLIIDGLIARLEKQDVLAIRNFDQAAISATASGFIHDSAIAHEQLALTCVLTGLVSGTHHHLRVARDSYRLWGAHAKVRQMEAEHSFLTIDAVREPARSAALQERVDIEAGIGAAKAVSEEVHLDRLVETLMTQLIVYAGADRGALVTVDGATLKMAALAQVSGGDVIAVSQAADAGLGDLPTSVLYATVRSCKALVIDDANRQCPIAHRADFAHRQARSVLCLPLMLHGKLLALLYLENGHISRLFDSKKLAMLEVLGSQAAVSLHTAQIYAQTLEESRLRAKTELELSLSRAELARSSHMAVLGELAASIAHEISQPLLSIMSNSAASLRWLNRDAPRLEEVRAGLQDISADSQRAAGILRALRALAAQVPMQISLISVDGIIRDVLRLLMPKLSANGVHLDIILAAHTLIPGDPVQIQQLLFNLITNAIDAMTHHREAGRLLIIRTESDERWLRVTIHDNGSGMPEAHREKAFDPFFTTKGSGMGMGLAICRSIVGAHHGSLQVDAQVESGCRMRFELPVKSPE